MEVWRRCQDLRRLIDKMNPERAAFRIAGEDPERRKVIMELFQTPTPGTFYCLAKIFWGNKEAFNRILDLSGIKERAQKMLVKTIDSQNSNEQHEERRLLYAARTVWTLFENPTQEVFMRGVSVVGENDVTAPWVGDIAWVMARFLDHKDPGVRIGALKILQICDDGSEAVDRDIVALLEDPDMCIRSEAIETVRQRKTAKAASENTPAKDDWRTLTGIIRVGRFSSSSRSPQRLAALFWERFTKRGPDARRGGEVVSAVRHPEPGRNAADGPRCVKRIAPLGFEPRYPDPESGVLPLDDGADRPETARV